MASQLLAALDIRGLSAAYEGHLVLHDIELAVAAGEWFVVLGPNGSGKSTLLDCVVGRKRPSSGSVTIANHDLFTSPLAAKRLLGYAVAPEHLPAVLNGWQCLEVHAAVKGLKALDTEVLALAESLRLSPWLANPVATFSFGTRQKLSLLLALLGEPRLVVLDETLNGMDPSSALTAKQHLLQRVRAGKSGVLLATHSLDLVEHYADRAALIVEGRLLQTWQACELDRLREIGGLESALACAAS